MIALLRGDVFSVGSDHVVLDVNGVGYRVSVPTPLVTRLAPGQAATLHISTIVREDAFLLYGFSGIDERDAFDVLRGVNKIGPKHALAALSTLSLGELTRAVAGEDVVALTRVPGVGRKTASRLVLELKGKLPDRFEPDRAGTAAAKAPARVGDPLLLALARLDFRKSEIDRAVASSDVPGMDEAPLESRLRASLRVLAPQS